MSAFHPLRTFSCQWARRSGCSQAVTSRAIHLSRLPDAMSKGRLGRPRLADAAGSLISQAEAAPHYGQQSSINRIGKTHCRPSTHLI